jgi:hypothetical protein
MYVSNVRVTDLALNSHSSIHPFVRSLVTALVSSVQLGQVIGFQEVRAARHSALRVQPEARSQVSALAAMLPGWQYVWVPAMSFMEGETEYHSEGLAIFSRFPMVDMSFIRLRYVN